MIRTAIYVFLLISSVCLQFSFSQAPPRQSERASSSGRIAADPIQSLIDDSRSLPPEFASDVIIQLAQHGLIRDGKLKAKLLKEAFEKASLSQDDYQERPWGVNVEETPGGLHALASYITGLNRLSLQTRVVREVFPTSPQRARELFELIHAPGVPPLPCDASWYFFPEAYYNTLGIILEGGFSNHEIAGGFRSSYVASLIRNIKSHVELIYAVQLLGSVHFTDQELQEDLVPAYVATLRNLGGDPQSFAIVMSGDQFFDGVSKFISLLEKHEIQSRPVLEAMREYLVRNFSGQCCDSIVDPKGSALPVAVARFNEEFGARLRGAELSSIDVGELMIKNAPHTEASAPPRWSSKTYSDLLGTLQSLNAPPISGDSAGTSAALNAFLTRAHDFLTALSGWSETNEPQMEFFHQKALLLAGLTERTTGTPFHKEALGRFIDFLVQYPSDQVGPVDWYFYAKKLLRGDVGAKYSTEYLNAFLNSGDPVLSVYARLGLLLQESSSGSAKHQLVVLPAPSSSKAIRIAR